MRIGVRLAAFVLPLLAAAWSLPGARAAEEPAADPWVVGVNALKGGLEDWNVEAPAKTFAWNADEGAIVVKGQSGKVPPRAWYRKRAWPEFTAWLRVKKGANKPRVLLVPFEAKSDAISLEIPKKALGTESWTEVTLRVAGTRAAIVKGDEELGGVDLPAGKRWHLGFEAPSGTSASFGGLRMERRYANPPQFAEEGFTSLFDGTSLGELRPAGGEGADRRWRVENGLIVGENRDAERTVLLIARELKAYELRFTLLWGGTEAMVRAVEIEGKEKGKINTFDTVDVNFTDHMDPTDSLDCTIRVADGKCIAVANGKTVLEQKTVPFPSTIAAFLLGQGKKVFLRDVRIKDLSK
jgi:hypothetical protein